eukprot:TRINITY_DN2813_c1_g1_i1.p1 TRINITY_DN2813_c1_g1~~TRINITY_DN2813_c1_g1_i1.p1  ORF type:complete len:720 (+),score=86.84 TRINITY_DN2813_c1_g1_i1:224-2383(+)
MLQQSKQQNFNQDKQASSVELENFYNQQEIELQVQQKVVQQQESNSGTEIIDNLNYSQKKVFESIKACDVYEQQSVLVQMGKEEGEVSTTQQLGQFKTQRKRGDSNSPRQRAKNRKKQFSQPVTAPIHRRYDMVWQDTPARVLKYRPSFLHQLGWLPFFSILNIRATVLSDPYLHIQSFVLVAVMLLIHLSGLWLAEEDLRGFISMFSTSYLGSIWNASMIVTFLLGLFVSEVYRRWWDIRTMYARLSSSTMDLCETITNMVRNPAGSCEEQRHINRARTELVRYLNLGHMLVITMAASQGRRFRRRTYYSKIKNFVQPGRNAERRYEAKNLSYAYLNQVGLVNWDEWQLMERYEGRGMPTYLTVYHWTQQLIYKVSEEGWVLNKQMVPPMIKQLSTIIESGQGIFTFINSQLPYPYVHLVSMATHLYLFFIAVYMGVLLHVGIRSDKITVSFSTFVELSSKVVEISKQDSDPMQTEVWQNATRDNGVKVQMTYQEGLPLINEYFSATWMYVLMCVINVVLQGLLNAHSLFDNPFGSHPSKFPLRLMATELINVTRSLLRGADDLPSAFNDIFQPTPYNQSPSPSFNQPQVKGQDEQEEAGQQVLFSGLLDHRNSQIKRDPLQQIRSFKVDFINPEKELTQDRRGIVWGGIDHSYTSHRFSSQTKLGQRQISRQVTMPIQKSHTSTELMRIEENSKKFRTVPISHLQQHFEDVCEDTGK